MEVIAGLAAADSQVRGIRFRRNFGKAAALSAGFAEARAELVMTLDADLQDDPHEIPRFLAEMENRLDVVSGWKKVRHDPWHKVLPSRVFNRMVSWLTGVVLHDHNCGMKCYRRQIFDEVQLYGELHRFVPVLAAARGYRVGELVIHHRPRRFGRSKYGAGRIRQRLPGSAHGEVPHRFRPAAATRVGRGGAGLVRVGGPGNVVSGRYWLVAQLNPQLHLQPLHQRPAVLYSMGLLLLGGQLMSVGFLAELFIAFHVPASRGYSIAQRTPASEPASPTFRTSSASMNRLSPDSRDCPNFRGHHAQHGRENGLYLSTRAIPRQPCAAACTCC